MLVSAAWILPASFAAINQLAQARRQGRMQGLVLVQQAHQAQHFRPVLGLLFGLQRPLQGVDMARAAGVQFAHGFQRRFRLVVVDQQFGHGHQARGLHAVVAGDAGQPLVAARLLAHLQKAGLQPGTGTLDISFHRDDIGRNPIPKEFAPTIIPHDVNGATVILVDDVLYSGRTVKAALDELFDHGRPTRVELAVLVDRGGRRLPVAAEYTGLTLSATETEKVVVNLDPKQPGKDMIAVDPIDRKSRYLNPVT